jgi:cystathionine beta-synthase
MLRAMFTGDVTQLIGNTPIVKLTHFDTGLCSLYVKLENQNPGGSIKDRIGLSMIRAAEQEGKLGGDKRHLVEATAGNTGLSLALVAAQRGYKLTLVIPDKMSQEKIHHLRALGVEIVSTRSDVGKGHPEYYQDVAKRIADETGAFLVGQFENPANPLAHETQTGPEIFQQTGGNVDAVVVGVGSGGTLTGLSRFFARVKPGVDMVVADPQGSIIADYVKTGKLGTAGSWVVEGVGEDFIPTVCDLSRVKHAYTVTDRESLDTARTLLKKTGILAGSSSGTLIAGALKYCREQTTKKNVVTFVCDSGNKYLSKMFNDYWMADQGFTDRPTYGDLRDVISRKYEERAIVTVSPSDTLLVAYGRMKLYDVSQLPVIEDGKIVGIVDESDLLLAALPDQAMFKKPVREVMSDKLTTLSVKTPIADLLPIFAQGFVPIVVENGDFLGLVTKIDLLNHLRRKMT